MEEPLPSRGHRSHRGPERAHVARPRFAARRARLAAGGSRSDPGGGSPASPSVGAAAGTSLTSDRPARLAAATAAVCCDGRRREDNSDASLEGPAVVPSCESPADASAFGWSSKTPQAKFYAHAAVARVSDGRRHRRCGHAHHLNVLRRRVLHVLHIHTRRIGRALLGQDVVGRLEGGQEGVEAVEDWEGEWARALGLAGDHEGGGRERARTRRPRCRRRLHRPLLVPQLPA